MLEALAHNIANFLHANPHWGLITTYFVAFFESLAVIGTIVPGSVTMTAIGALAGAGIIDGFWAYFWATTGALTGDTLSYWFGLYYGDRIESMWPFNKHPQWIQRGRVFFDVHGGKSVIIGRFFGPVRSFVPLIAGVLHMTPLRFMIAIIPAAFLWAVAYMTPGYLLGALSLELPAGTATKFILSVLGIIIVLWLLLWFVKWIIQIAWQTIDTTITKIWVAMRRSKSMHWFTTMLADPHEPNLHQQLTLYIFALASFCLLLGAIFSVMHHGIMTAIDAPLYHVLTSIRTSTLDNIFCGITLLGDRDFILVFTLLTLGVLCWQRQWRAAAHWLAMMVLCTSTILLFKHLYFSPRPNPLLTNVSSSSFPSGHTAFSATFYGFFAILIAQDLPSNLKRTPLLSALVITGFVAFSRLYLGAHWLSDVVTSLLLGLTLNLAMTLSYRRHLRKHLDPKKFAH